MRKVWTVAAAAALVSSFSQAQTLSGAAFVNGMAIAGNLGDLSSGSSFDRRVGFFSDIYYDRNRNEWWGLSDRGPGGGLLNYETRVQRFTLDFAANGAISNFNIVQTVKFNDGGAAMNGIAPNPGNALGRAFDPEGIVIHPVSGNLLVSDEYGPSVVEFDRNGNLLRRFTTPANLVPRNAAGVPNYASDTGNTLGKRTNRGFEGLAISPDGRYTYAMLQSAMLDEGAGNGEYNRIVKFDNQTGAAVGQYAYKMDSAAAGRGISALVALGNDRFLVLERNNRGVGIGATLATADKAVYQIDLAGAADVSGVTLPATGAFVGAVSKSGKLVDLDADTLAALGGKSPEKWEGLAVGPRLADGRYVLLAGTDNDYSVTQSGSGTQFDVYLRFSDADPYATSIQCPIGTTSGCFLTANNATPAVLSADFALLPGVLHAYTANIDGYLAPVPEVGSSALMAAGLLGLCGLARQRRRSSNSSSSATRA